MTAMSDGSYPIYDERSLFTAIRMSQSFDVGNKAVRQHIIDQAAVLNKSHMLPSAWMEVSALREEDKWWESALEKQVALKPQENCKMCRMITANETGIQAWMMTPCNRCGQHRGIHRPFHPHMIDHGNRNKKWKQPYGFDWHLEDCEGFEEPDLELLESELDRILEAHDG